MNDTLSTSLITPALSAEQKAALATARAIFDAWDRKVLVLSAAREYMRAAQERKAERRAATEADDAAA